MTSKERVLGLLRDARGTYLSGEQIASDLSLSRNAVWKAIQSLRRDGYRIDAATNRGYSLTGESAALSVDGMRPFLDAAVEADRIFVYPTLLSTNRTAKEMAIAGAGHGTVIAADAQTEGSGRHARSFYSPPGGIYLSVILRPERFPFADPSVVTAYAAVAVVETVRQTTGLRVGIKPVNDVYLGERKICGILTESVSDFESGEIQWIVAGIGINYSLRLEELPAELRDKAGALYFDGNGTADIPLEPPLPASRNQITAELLNRLLVHNLRCSADEIMERYRSLMLPQWK